MSLSINHPIGKVTSTTALSFEVQGGTPAAPKNITLSASSVIMPNVQQPVGQSGSIIFDSSTKRMKYYDGTQWISWVPSSEITGPITNEITNIYNELGTKVDSVIFNSSAIPSASISGSTLNITFPTGNSGSTGTPGLFTSLPTGAISYYSLISGQTPASIREQMGGSAGSQNGRNGTQANPYITTTGWTYADGNYWLWQGASGNVNQRVPNLNQSAYMKAMSTSGITKTDAAIASSGSVAGTSLSIANLPPHSFSVSGSTNFTGAHSHGMQSLWSARMSIDDVRVGVFRNGYNNYAGGNTSVDGDHSHTVTGSTNSLGSGTAHSHVLNDVDVAHFNVAVLYNIAQPSLALNQDIADTRYVLKSGDVMTGTLTVASSAIIRGDDTNLMLWYRNSANAERSAIYHNSSSNTLRLRANGGNELVISNTGLVTAPSLASGNTSVSGSFAVTGTSTLTGNLTLTGTATINSNATVGGKYVVRSVNGALADSTGNVVIGTTITGVRLGAAVRQYQGSWQGNYGGNYVGHVMSAYESYDNSRYLGVEIRPIQIQIDGTWYTISQL